MNLQSFIQSGLLEAYVLEQCTAEERAEVERMVAAHPELRQELDDIGQTLEKVALSNAVPPPSGLKAQILERIAQEAAPTITPKAPARRFSLNQLLGWAAALVLGIALIVKMGNLSTSENTIADLQKQVTECHSQAQIQDKLRQQVALLRDPDTHTTLLADDPANPISTTTVWHNSVRREIALDLNALPPPAKGKYYQFWAIVGSKPVSMGMVHVQEPGSMQSFEFVDDARGFAISAEDNPDGHLVPTIVVMISKT